MIDSQPTGPRTLLGLAAFIIGGIVLVGAMVFGLYQLGTFGRWLRVQYRRLRFRYRAPRKEAEHAAACIEILTEEEINEILATRDGGQQ